MDDKRNVVEDPVGVHEEETAQIDKVVREFIDEELPAIVLAPSGPFELSIEGENGNDEGDLRGEVEGEERGKDEEDFEEIFSVVEALLQES